MTDQRQSGPGTLRRTRSYAVSDRIQWYLLFLPLNILEFAVQANTRISQGVASITSSGPGEAPGKGLPSMLGIVPETAVPATRR